jgi:ActR/RegA family two-component response regulator
MTGFANSADTQRAEQLGALAVILKPLELDRLFGLVREFSRPGRKILVLEDNEALADNLGEALSHAGFEPLVVHSVREALAQEQLPRVAIVDYRLPDGSGLEAARRLVARDPTLQVIVLTGYAQEVREDAAAHPTPFVRQTLDKPVRIDALLSTLHKATLLLSVSTID